MVVFNQTALGTCWFPRRQLIELSVIWLAFACAFAVAQDSASDDAVLFPDVLEQFLENVTSMSASFEQELWTADQRLIESSVGTFSVKRPSRFRWHYTDPIETLIVTDGQTMWMYDVDIEQITRSDIGDAAQSSPAMLLSGDDSVRNSFDVVGTEQQGEILWVSLAPRLSGGEYELIRIGFVGETLARLEFVDGLEQTTSIIFRDVIVNPDLSDEVFEFVVPNGVHVIGATG